MSAYQRQLRRFLLHQLALQVGVALLSAIGFGLMTGPQAALATFIGTLVAAVNTLITLRCAQRTERMGSLEPGQNLRAMFRCEMARLAQTILSLALLLGVLHLLPLPLLSGFFAGQLVSLIANFMFKSR